MVQQVTWQTLAVFDRQASHPVTTHQGICGRHLGGGNRPLWEEEGGWFFGKLAPLKRVREGRCIFGPAVLFLPQFPRTEYLDFLESAPRGFLLYVLLTLDCKEVSYTNQRNN